MLLETREPVSKLGTDIICTNAYLGADAIAAAYAAGADVIVTGRVTDSALALGPIMATLGWQADDKDAMACGVLAGHLLECGGQATGGYFAEPGLKDVPDVDRIGFPIAEVRERSLDHHHQAAGQRRAHRPPHHHRADPLRDARPGARISRPTSRST